MKVSSKFVNEVTLEEKELLSNEDIKNGYRLACCTKIYGASEVYVPWSTFEAKQRIQIGGEESKVELSPIIRKFLISLPKISYKNDGIKTINISQRTSSKKFLSDKKVKDSHKAFLETYSNNVKVGFEIIKGELLKRFNITVEKIDYEVFKSLKRIIEKEEQEIVVTVRDKEIISVDLESETKKIYGIAIDLGTTKIAIYLMDLETGKTVDAVGMMNPQIAYGEDIISRLRYALESKDGLNRLKEIVLEKLNEEINSICKKNKIPPEQVMEAVIIGNTAMHHLLLGLPIKQLAMSPFKPAIKDIVEIKARDFGLDINKYGYIYFPSPIAGFVGSDHLAMILSSEIIKRKGNILCIDIGTNTEVVLKTDNILTCCSTASGPAFEGANIKHGMRASPGAIDSVVIEKDNLNVMVSTIDNYPPVGICGSGILDAVAEMLKTEIIDSSGKIIKGKGEVKVGSNKGLEYVLVKRGLNKDEQKYMQTERGSNQWNNFIRISKREKSYKIGVNNKKSLIKSEDNKTITQNQEENYITITQKDIREIQLAKGAIRTGIDILIKNANLNARDIDEVIIAGTFGTFIDIRNCIKIGMFPNMPVSKFHQVGNAAGIGAKHILISKKVRKKAKEVLQDIKYIELTTYPDFVKYFIGNLRF